MNFEEMRDKDIIYRALINWKNYIQTGELHLSTESAIKIGQPEKIRMINSDQQEFIIRLEEIAHKIINNY